MKYYVVEISEGDAKIKGKGMYEFEDRTLAVASFHSKMGVAMKSELYTREQLMVINEKNQIECAEVFARPLPEPEPEPVVEPAEEVVEEPSVNESALDPDEQGEEPAENVTESTEE